MDLGVVIDLETTGLDAKKDQIIEIGILEFVVKEGVSPQISGAYAALQDPGVPLSEEIQRITGLNDQLLEGRQIDWQHVRRVLTQASVVIAHNAKFDSSFLRQRQELAGVSCHWACSAKHIPWQKLGFRTQALNYLAADHGFVNPFAHRALFDCATTFRLVAPYMDELIMRSYEREFVLHATGSPFETKDKLRMKGYRWDPDLRCWLKQVLECDLEEERGFLSAEIYSGPAGHREIPVDEQNW